MKKGFALLLAALLLLAPARAARTDPPVSRGAFVQALWELWGSVPYEDTRVFSDLPHDALCTTAVCWARDLALIRGVGGGCFAPERPITREEAAVFLRRAAAHLGRETATVSNLAMCNDYADISPWADDSLYWATESGLIDWAEGGLRASYGTVTAAEMAAIYRRFDHP